MKSRLRLCDELLDEAMKVYIEGPMTLFRLFKKQTSYRIFSNLALCDVLGGEVKYFGMGSMYNNIM